MAEDISVLGIAVETRGVKEGSDALDKLALSGAGAEKATALLATETKKTSSVIAGLAKDYQSAGDSISDALKKLRIRDSSAIAKEANEIRNALNQIKATGSLDDITRASIAAKAAMSSLRTEFDGIARMPKLNPIPDLAPHIAGMNKLGMSANATAAAMRNVPAQFTDIITSLQGGQAPLTVLMQQGGQLKDMFGGVGNAAKAIGGYALGLVNPFTVAAAAAAALGVAYYQGSGEAQAFTSSLILSGNAAGVTAGQLMDMAKSLSESSGATRGSIAETLNEIASSGKISSAVLAQVGKAATDMQKAGGAAASDTVKEFEAIGVSPVAAILKLNEKYHFLTAAVYEQIKALQDQGRETDAANLAQTTYANTLEGRIPGMVSNLGSVERAWKSIVGGAKSAWDAMLNIGREGGLEEQLAKAKKYAENLARSGDSNTPEGERSNSQAQQAIKAIEEKIKKQGQLTDAEVETNKAREAGLKWSISSAKYLDDDAKKRAEILRVTNEMTAAGVSQSEQAKILAKIEESYSTKKSASNKALREDYSELFSRQEQEARNRKDAEKELDSLAKANEAYAKSIEAIYAPLEKEAGSIELQLQNYGLTRAEIEATTIARLEENRVILSGQEGMGELVANLDREIAARKRIKEASEGIDSKKSADEQIKASKHAAEKAAEDWKKTSDKIGDSITDALMRGFESGKGFAETLRDTVVNMFNTMVLQPVIKATVVGGLSAIGLGSGSALAGTSSSIGSISSAGNMLSGAKTAYDMYSGGTQALFQNFATSKVGSAIGLSAMGSAATPASTSMGITIQGASTPYMTSAGMTASSVIPIVGWIMAGMAANNSFYDQGFTLKNADGTTKAIDASSFVLTSALEKIGLSGKVASMLTGNSVVNKMFGYGNKEVKDTGTQGTFTADGFYGQNFAKWEQKGGWFRSDKSGTDTSAISAEADSILDLIVKASAASFQNLFRVMGEAPRSLDGWSFSIKQNLSSQGEMNAMIKSLGDSMATWLVPEFAALKNEGESLSDTVIRMQSEFVATDRIVEMLGLSATAFGSVGIASAAARDGLVDAAGSLDALSSGVATYYASFYSDAEKQTLAASDLSKSFAALGLAVPASKDAFKSVVKSLDLTTTAGQTTFAAMMKLAPSFATVADAAEAAAKAAKAAYDSTASAMLSSTVATASDAYSALESAVSAQKSAIQTAYDAQDKINQASIDASEKVKDNLSSLADTLKSAVWTITADSDAGLLSRRNAAQAVLDDAYSASQRGQSLAPFADSITSAITDLSKPSDQIYSTFEEYARAQGRANAALSGLKLAADDQLNVADLTLKAIKDAADEAEAQNTRALAALDQQLANAKTQIDALNGINTSVLSVAAAMSALASAMSVAGAVKTALPAASASKATTSDIVKDYQNILGRAPDASGLVYWQQQANAGASAASIANAFTNSPEGKVAGLYSDLLGRAPDAAGSAVWQGLIASGASVAEITAAIKDSEEYRNSHAAGLERVPYDGYKATLHAGEAVVDAQSTRAISRYFGGGGGNSNNEALILEVKALREELNLLRYEARATATNTNKVAKTIDKWDNDGLPAEKVAA